MAFLGLGDLNQWRFCKTLSLDSSPEIKMNWIHFVLLLACIIFASKDIQNETIIFPYNSYIMPNFYRQNIRIGSKHKYSNTGATVKSGGMDKYSYKFSQ